MTGRRPHIHGSACPAPPRAAWTALALALAVALAACGRADDDAGPAAVATVGETAITADEFATNYALGFRHHKAGPDPRGAYLERMIEERLLALEGRRLGLDDLPAVRRKVESLRAEQRVEAVFEHEVNARVTVTDAEVEAAMAEDAVRFRLRFLPAPTRAAARALATTVRSDGFEAARDDVLRRDAEGRWRAGDFESPDLAAHDLDPALLDAVADLPVGAVSDPVPYRGQFLVLQVADVRRAPLGAAPGPDERARYEHLVFLQKAKAEARRFVGETMRPVDLRVRPAPFRLLRESLWTLVQDEAPTGLLKPYVDAADGPAADTLRAHYGDVLMTTRDGDWTVAAFLDAYPADRYPLDPASREAFERDLYDALGLTLRDRAFEDRARAEGWAETPEARAERARWTDRWVYRALLDRMADTVHVTVDEARAYFARHADYYRRDGAAVAFEDVEAAVRADVRRAKRDAALPGLLAALRERYPVTVHHAVLDTLTLDDAGAGPDVLLFKGHTGRLAYPVVDPAR